MNSSTPCAYCGGHADQVDHVVPLGQGGVNEASNWVAACGTCCTEKGERGVLEWRAWREARGWCWPPRNPPEGMGRAAAKGYRNGVVPVTGCTHPVCNNWARVGHDTCRWHDPEVMAARQEAEQARQRALRAAGAA